MGSGSKTCRLCLYQFTASLLLSCGVILCIVGLATSALFVSLLKGREASIRSVDIFFGLFSSTLRVDYKNGTSTANSFSTVFSDIEASNWRGAQAVCILATLAGIVAVILHFFILFSSSLRKWHVILLELILHLFVVSFIIAGVALVETHLYYLNVNGDTFLLKLLRRYDLVRHTGGPLDRSFKGPMYTYWVLVAADFCFLLALLCCLPEFIAVIDAKRRRDREKKYPELKKATRV